MIGGGRRKSIGTADLEIMSNGGEGYKVCGFLLVLLRVLGAINAANLGTSIELFLKTYNMSKEASSTSQQSSLSSTSGSKTRLLYVCFSENYEVSDSLQDPQAPSHPCPPRHCHYRMSIQLWSIANGR